MMHDDQLYEIFKECKELGALAQLHAENGDVIYHVCVTCHICMFKVLWEEKLCHMYP